MPGFADTGFNEAGILHPEKHVMSVNELKDEIASMRPGFYTRKSAAIVAVAVKTTIASMRPGFYTRKSRSVRRAGAQSQRASMRPGFYTRKSWLAGHLVPPDPDRFNEAGILHPEKLGSAPRGSRTRPCFNEAGILHPEKHHGLRNGGTATGWLQ